jgi:hypothetical protein
MENYVPDKVVDLSVICFDGMYQSMQKEIFRWNR